MPTSSAQFKVQHSPPGSAQKALKAQATPLLPRSLPSSSSPHPCPCPPAVSGTAASVLQSSTHLVKCAMTSSPLLTEKGTGPSSHLPGVTQRAQGRLKAGPWAPQAPCCHPTVCSSKHRAPKSALMPPPLSLSHASCTCGHVFIRPPCSGRRRTPGTALCLRHSATQKSPYGLLDGDSTNTRKISEGDRHGDSWHQRRRVAPRKHRSVHLSPPRTSTKPDTQRELAERQFPLRAGASRDLATYR